MLKRTCLPGFGDTQQMQERLAAAKYYAATQAATPEEAATLKAEGDEFSNKVRRAVRAARRRSAMH